MRKILFPLLLAACAAAPGETSRSAALPACEWCGADEAPAELTSEMVLAGPAEPGERLVVTGTVFEPDGRTPAAGVLVYAYQTDLTGRYTTRGDETGNGRRHGRLRGWLVTDADGRYRIETIRPGGYPGSREPAHIHMTVRAPGAEETWIDSIELADDPRLTAAQRARRDGRGGSGNRRAGARRGRGVAGDTRRGAAGGAAVSEVARRPRRDTRPAHSWT